MTFFNWRTQARLARSLTTRARPIYVQYYVTARCNLACEQCNIIYANADNQELNLDQVAAMAANLAEIGVSVVLLTGGEPFVRRDLPEIVGIFRKQNIHVRCQTNGLASRDRLQRCVDAGINDISISLDSLEPDRQDTINGDVRDSWHKALEAVSMVNDLFPSDAFAVFGCVLAPRNFLDVPDVIRFATKIGWWVSLVPAHVAQRQEPMNFRTYDPSLLFSPDQYPQVRAVLDEVAQMRRAGMHVYDSEEYLEDIYRFVTGEPLHWRRRNDGVCDSPNLYFAVQPNGNMAACCDIRLHQRVPVYDDEFPRWYREGRIHSLVQPKTSACNGCLYGSFPEISISARYFTPLARRSMFFFFRRKSRLLRAAPADLEVIAAELRSRNEMPIKDEVICVPSPGAAASSP